MTDEELLEELEGKRVCDRQAARGEETPPAPVPEAGSRRKAGRSRRGVQDSQSLAEMVGASPSKDAQQQSIPSVSDLLDQGRGTDQRGPGSDVSVPSENADRPLSFRCLLGNVSFNADGESKVVFESMLDLEQIVQLRNYRNQFLTLEIHRA